MELTHLALLVVSDGRCDFSIASDEFTKANSHCLLFLLDVATTWLDSDDMPSLRSHCLLFLMDVATALPHQRQTLSARLALLVVSDGRCDFNSIGVSFNGKASHCLLFLMDVATVVCCVIVAPSEVLALLVVSAGRCDSPPKRREKTLPSRAVLRAVHYTHFAPATIPRDSFMFASSARRRSHSFSAAKARSFHEIRFSSPSRLVASACSCNT